MGLALECTCALYINRSNKTLHVATEHLIIIFPLTKTIDVKKVRINNQSINQLDMT